mgnify:CR=1 FL=1
MKLIRKKLGDLTLHVTDGEHGSVIDDPSAKYYLLSNKNIINGQIVITEDDRRISLESFQKINRRTKLSKNDVVLSTVGTIGKAAIIDSVELNYDFQRSVGIIKCDPKKLTPQYLLHYFNQSFVQKRLHTLSKGAVQRCLFISDLNDLDIDIPENYNDQLEIINTLKIIDRRIATNNSINNELRLLGKELFNYSFFNSSNIFINE